MTFAELEGGEMFIKKDDARFPQAFLFRKLLSEDKPYKVQFPTSDGRYIGPGDINAISAHGTMLVRVNLDEEVIWIK